MWDDVYRAESDSLKFELPNWLGGNSKPNLPEFTDMDHYSLLNDYNTPESTSLMQNMITKGAGNIGSDSGSFLGDFGDWAKGDEKSMFSKGSPMMGALGGIKDLYGAYNQRKMMGMYKTQLDDSRRFNEMNAYASMQDANRQIAAKQAHNLASQGIKQGTTEYENKMSNHMGSYGIDLSKYGITG